MTIESDSDEEFMHKPGEMFIAGSQIHILKAVGHGFTPADSDCEEYVAVCGFESQSWGMPSQGVGWANFISSLTDNCAKGIGKCEDCFK